MGQNNGVLEQSLPNSIPNPKDSNVAIDQNDNEVLEKQETSSNGNDGNVSVENGSFNQ